MAVPALVAKYAPLVRLHRAEKLLPTSPDRFVAHSRLRWATGRGLDGEAVTGAAGKVSASRLGVASKRPYKHGRFGASALTRPLDDSPQRRGGPPLEQGFFLRLPDAAAARGDKSTSPDASVYSGTPVCYDWDREAKAITYWLFYAASSPPLGLLRADKNVGGRASAVAGRPSAEPPPDEIQAAVAAAALEEFQRAYPGLAEQVGVPETTRAFRIDPLERLRTAAEAIRALLREDDVLHEGDWERITVYLDEVNPEDAPPFGVQFYRHSTDTFRRWADVKKEDGTHPIVYSAIGSHASLPSADYGFIDVGDARGLRWRTWEPDDGLLPVAEQSWYGFGGAWGRLGRVRDSTGPLGPGAHWKHAAPRPADRG